jgi:radical SAM superfamily enzyme YgiQ (UPF0313 family)
MKVVLVGAELEENLGLRYMVSALLHQGHQATIVPFNEEAEIPQTLKKVLTESPDIVGLSMVFTSRGREFCRFAEQLKEAGYGGHLTCGGHFAAFNCQRLLADYPAFDSVALGEGEELICLLADNLEDLSEVPGFCYRKDDGEICLNPGRANPENLDALPFPYRTEFHEYYGKPIGSILSSRGCWRSCAFCSINAWYRSGGGKKFRIRSIENIVSEMKELYHTHGVRVFNFQDDNFFLPDRKQALERFIALRDELAREGVEKIAIAVKARPDSITREAISVLDELGIFRVFLGVENASQRGLDNLNRQGKVEQIEPALTILNDFDVHIAYNLLMFEPDTTMEDILINLRFIERHVDNPLNFCRAEAYACTGLEKKLREDNILEGDYFGFDYRIKDPHVETFHKIANYAFFDRNFSDFGLHYFNMEVDFSYQLMRRFHLERLCEELRAEVRAFIKETNVDTHRHLCRIYDFVQSVDPINQDEIELFMKAMRHSVDESSRNLRAQGQRIMDRLEKAYAGIPLSNRQPFEKRHGSVGLTVLDSLFFSGTWKSNTDDERNKQSIDAFNLLGSFQNAVPYETFKSMNDGKG